MRASDSEVMRLVEQRRLRGRGLGWIDAHLLASAHLSHCRLWTLDKRLASAAFDLGLRGRPLCGCCKARVTRSPFLAPDARGLQPVAEWQARTWCDIVAAAMGNCVQKAVAVFAAAAFILCADDAVPVQFRPGIWTADDAATLPLPASGYQVYLIGELHGVQENTAAFAAHLTILVRSGLRDVAIEEDSVYERAAQAYVAGRLDRLPEQLCLRAGVLDVVRSFNSSRSPDNLIRVHLVDIDTPASAIHRHLAMVREQMPGVPSPPVSDVKELKDQGLRTVDALKRALTLDNSLHNELRTIRYSILAYRDGLEVDVGQPKGSPYLESREQAIAANIKSVLAEPDCRGILVQYGSDHVSKVNRKDGGPNRNSTFAPMALRLERDGVKVYSLLTIPLSGNWQWRGRKGEMFWGPSDVRLSTGERLDEVLTSVQQHKFVFVDPKVERLRLPSHDLNGFRVDANLLFATGTPLQDQCSTGKPD
jgi:hypothetical protein